MGRPHTFWTLAFRLSSIECQLAQFSTDGALKQLLDELLELNQVRRGERKLAQIVFVRLLV